MSDSLITIIAIFLAALLLFFFPFMVATGTAENATQAAAQAACVEFVDDSRTIAKVTWENYNEFVEKLSATGNAYDVEMRVDIIDENVGKKSAWVTGTVIGENVYYSVYTTQILDQMKKGGDSGVFNMKEGDIFYAGAENLNPTLGENMRNFFFSIPGSGVPSTRVSHAGVCTGNSKENN